MIVKTEGPTGVHGMEILAGRSELAMALAKLETGCGTRIFRVGCVYLVKAASVHQCQRSQFVVAQTTQGLTKKVCLLGTVDTSKHVLFLHGSACPIFRPFPERSGICAFQKISFKFVLE
jgi:hypothetical protein